MQNYLTQDRRIVVTILVAILVFPHRRLDHFQWYALNISELRECTTKIGTTIRGNGRRSRQRSGRGWEHSVPITVGITEVGLYQLVYYPTLTIVSEYLICLNSRHLPWTAANTDSLCRKWEVWCGAFECYRLYPGITLMAGGEPLVNANAR